MNHNIEPAIIAALQQIFPDLSPADLTALTDVAELHTYPTGTRLCHEGLIEDTFYIIISGSVAALKKVDENQEQFLKKLDAGEFFGEIALIQEGPRVADIATLEPTTVLEIHREDFLSLLNHSGPLAMRIMLGISWRLRDADQRSLTELRRRHDELSRAYAELAEQERMRSDFLTTVSHELRTPLAVATGYLQLLNSGAVPGEQAPHFLKTVARSLDDVVQLVNNILFLQELDLITPEFTNLEIVSLVDSTLAGLRDHAATSNLTLTLTVDPDLPIVRGDANSLQRALHALLDNAIKFSPEGGDINVRLYPTEDALCIEIRDPGVGFPMEALDEIFKPFKRIESAGGHLFGGIGIGLPIARHIIAAHGGHIAAQSTVGRGSTFTVILPLPKPAP